MRLQERVDAGSQRALEAELRRPDFQFAQGAAESFRVGNDVVSVDNGELKALMKLVQWFHRGDGDPEPGRRLGGRRGSEREWGVRRVKHPCSGLSPCVCPGGLTLECSGSSQEWVPRRRCG